MKTLQTGMPRTNLYRAEAEVGMHIKALFRRCPALAGFAIKDLAQFHDNNEQDDEETQLVVTDIALLTPLSPEEIDKVCKLVSATMCDVLSERPDAIELLRGRTFARTFH